MSIRSAIQAVFPGSDVDLIADAFESAAALGSDGLLAHGTLAVDATPEDFKTTTRHVVRVNGEPIGIAAAAVTSFTAAHTVTAAKFGAILIQRTHLGVISTKVVASPQAYNDAPAALAALPAPDAGKFALGSFVIGAGVADWVGNTSDMTAASDLASITITDATVLS